MTPQPDAIGGTVAGVGEVSTNKHGGAVVPLLRIQNGDGKLTEIPCWRVHLRQLVEENRPEPGDLISIRAFGARPGELQKLYGMRVVKASQEVGSDADIPF